VINLSKLLSTPEILLFAFLLDLLLGDPRRFPHPTVGMGKVAQLLEKPLRDLGRLIGGAPGAFLAGLLMVTILAGGSLVLTSWLLTLIAGLNHLAWVIASVFMIYSTIALKSLAEHARRVERPLQAGNIEEARQAVGMIVGRDTSVLDESGVARAAVESIAENTSDGIVAPLFYAAIGGPPLAIAYRAVNTLDAMYGHKEPDNLFFGRAAARMDDLLNYLPSRLTALMFLAAGFFAGMNTGLGWKTLLTDGGKHDSPNSGRPEAAMAGLLNVRLGGPIYRSGSLDLPYLNSKGRPTRAEDISRAIKIMFIGSILTLAICLAGNFLLIR
jgi:adenosylcobinamide-phosphate synthase